MSFLSHARRLTRAAAFLGAALVAAQAAPASAQTTLGDGVNPAPATACPAPNPPAAASPVVVNAFTFTSTTGDTINQVRVQLAPTNAWQLIERIEIRNAGLGVLHASKAPLADLEIISLTTPIVVAANAAPAGYVVAIIPKSHAAMPRTDAGQAVAVTARVTQFASAKTKVLADTASGVVTLDNLAPANVIWDSATSTPTGVDLRWKGSQSVVVLRKAGGPVTDGVTEGATYTAGAVLAGGAQVAYAGTSDRLVENVATRRPYYYRVFSRDACGNYSPGVSVGPLTPDDQISEGDAARPSYRAVVGLLNPLSGTVNSPFRVQVRVFSPKSAGGAIQPIGAVELGVDSGSGYVWTALQRNAAYGSAADSGIWEALPDGFSIPTPGGYTIRARAYSSASPNPVYSAAVGVVVSPVKGDGNLLVRDNANQLCQDCHTGIRTHSSEFTGTEQGSWYVGCRSCHAPHGTTNAGLVATEITPPAVRGNYGPSKVVFSGVPGYSATGGAANPSAGAYANGDPDLAPGSAHTGVCQVCHTTTQYWTRTGAVSDHYGDQKCTSCHSHAQGMAASCNGCHGDASRASLAGADGLQNAAPPRSVSGATAATDQAVGAHLVHVNLATYRSQPLGCVECHPSPNTHHETPGEADIAFGALASHGSSPTYNPATSTCSSTYCHGATLTGGANVAPGWNTGDSIGCASCHGAPPPLSVTSPHPRNGACASCHGTGYSATTVAKATHLDTNLDLVSSGCTACHGTLSASGVTLAANLERAAPGVEAGSVDVAGGTAATRPGVGAHEKHLAGTRLREQGGATCTDCHALPASDADTSHATGVGTGGARATIAFSAFTKGGTADYAAAYAGSNSATTDTAAGSCSSTYCHGQKYAADANYRGTNQTPSWTGGAAAAACGTCHKAPPTTPAHGSVDGTSNCGMCHPGFDYTLSGGGTLGPNHLNGEANFGGGSCTSCHGTDGVNAAPPKLVNVANANGIGAHQAHVNTANMVTRSVEYACTECHPNPSGSHPEGGAVQMAYDLAPTTVWNDAASSCATSYCHGGTPAQAAWGGTNRTPIFTDATDTYRSCSACHASPPPLNASSAHPPNTSCASCHGAGASASAMAAPAAAKHVDGSIDVTTSGCTRCHGDLSGVNTARTSLAVAPGFFNGSAVVGVDASGATTGARVGAHRQHLQGTSLRSASIACDECHVVPATADQTHATGVGTSTARATLTFGAIARTGGLTPSFATGSCATTYCHGGEWATNPVYAGTNVAPGWNGGAVAAACGTCHKVAPTSAAHASVTSTKNCNACHTGYDCTSGNLAACTVNKADHIDGNTDVSTTCSSCHGTTGRTLAGGAIGTGDALLAASPPTDSLGAATGNKVGPHMGHVNPDPAQAAGQMLTPVLCSECHGNAVNTYPQGHANGSVQVTFADATRSDLGGMTPTVSGSNPVTCNSNYCHGASFSVAARGNVATWTWNGSTSAACDSCHKGPPTDPVHTSVAKPSAPSACNPCHGTTVGPDGKIVFIAGATAHIDGDVDLTVTCRSCHGSATNAAPPALANSANTNGVGAHQSHVNATLLLTRTTAFGCNDCHPTPTEMNHASGGAPQMQWSVLAGAATTWNDGPSTCGTSYCHGASSTTPPGASVPQTAWGGIRTLALWTDSGDTYRACNACHGAPPTLSATNPHPPNTTCNTCHPDGASTTAMTAGSQARANHVNGTVNLDRTGGCAACHGDLTASAVASGSLQAMPGYNGTGADASGATTGARVGAHRRHLQLTTITTSVQCTSCHAVPASGTSHATGVSPNTGARATVSFAGSVGGSSGSYASGSCASTYCHGNFAAGRTATVTWTGGALTGCNACHGQGTTAAAVAPPSPHIQDNACGNCHPGYTATTVDASIHINGTGDLRPDLSCSSCHFNTSDVPNYVYGDGTASKVDSAQWAASGHGQTAAAFSELSSATDRCAYCHETQLASGNHNQPGNPFRLRGGSAVGGSTTATPYDATSAATVNRVCLNCHGPAGNGVDPDAAGAQPLASATLKVDTYHYGGDHAAARDGGMRCWDCHDAHGDGNIKMVASNAARESADAHGYSATRVTTNIVFTANAAGSDFVKSASPYTGVCQACHTSTSVWTSTGGGTNHNASMRCTRCHAHQDTTKNLAFKGTGDCVQCHNTTQPITVGPLAGNPTPRPNVMTEFNQTWSHKRSGGKVPTKYDCTVCHMEGDAANNAFPMTDHADGLVHLRNPDTGTNITGATWSGTGAGGYTTNGTAVAFARFSRNLNSSTLEATTTAIMINQCLKCHDADGAQSPAARAPTGTAGRPFGTTISGTTYNSTTLNTACVGPAAWSSTTTYAAGVWVTYNGIPYRSLQASNLNRQPDTQTTWWQAAQAYAAGTTYAIGTWVSSGGRYYLSVQASNVGNDPATRPYWWRVYISNENGCVTNVARSFDVNNSSYHPVLGKNNNWYSRAGRMVAPWNLAKVNTTTPSVNEWGLLLSCWDCHANPADSGTIQRTVTAHGGANTVRGVPAVTGTPSSTNAVTLCNKCHYLYDTCGTVGGTCGTPTHGSGSAVSSNLDRSEKVVFLRYGCNKCHASSYTTAVARPVRAEDVHGFDRLPGTGTDAMWPTGATESRKPYAFIRNTQLFSSHQPGRIGATTYTPTCVHLNDGTCSSRTETYTVGGTY